MGSSQPLMEASVKKVFLIAKFLTKLKVKEDWLTMVMIGFANNAILNTFGMKKDCNANNALMDVINASV